jgi:hypothetical protein
LPANQKQNPTPVTSLDLLVPDGLSQANSIAYSVETHRSRESRIATASPKVRQRTDSDVYNCFMPFDEKQLELPPSSQDRGELLQALKQFARERYLQLEIGTKAEFEELWRKALFADERPENR